jgi:hypothetical protein
MWPSAGSCQTCRIPSAGRSQFAKGEVPQRPCGVGKGTRVARFATDGPFVDSNERALLLPRPAVPHGSSWFEELPLRHEVGESAPQRVEKFFPPHSIEIKLVYLLA